MAQIKYACRLFFVSYSGEFSESLLEISQCQARLLPAQTALHKSYDVIYLPKSICNSITRNLLLLVIRKPCILVQSAAMVMGTVRSQTQNILFLY